MLSGITRSAEFNDAGRRVGTLVEGFAGISKSYDYLIVSGGPMKDYPELLGLAAITLSTFLLIDAGRTRQASARNSVEVLNSYGFSKVNLVLNRRTYPVPEWLMRRI
jgi:Mrp family chromosome partitioning ATPase